MKCQHQERCKSASSRTIGILVLLILLVPVAVEASVHIENQMRASIVSVPGPQLYAYGTGATAEYTTEAEWETGSFSDTVYDNESGVVLGRKGDGPPSEEVDWWNDNWLTRRCYHIDNIIGEEEQDAVATLIVDTTAEVPERMRADGADIRVVLSADGSELPLWFDPQAIPGDTTTVEVQIPTLPTDGTDVCLYWGNADAASVSEPNRLSGNQNDGELVHRQWLGLDRNLLNSADFTRPPTSNGPTLCPKARIVSAMIVPLSLSTK